MPEQQYPGGDFPGNIFPLDQVAIRLVDLPPLMSHERLDTPEKVAYFMAETLRDYDREVFCVVNVRPDMKPINLNFVSMGSLTESMVHPREVLKSSILSNASGVLLIHNHTTGEVYPSRADISITDRLSKACDLIGIPVIDHLIVGPSERYYSFKEKGTLTYERNHYAETIEEIEMEGIAVQEQKNTFDPHKAAEDRKKEMEEITAKLEKGVKDVFNGDNYKNYLNFCAKLPRYSVNNQLLIMMQRPDATMCQSFTGWKDVNRFVKKGEKGIRILAPAPYKLEKEQEKTDVSGKVMLDKDGEPITEKVQITINAFKTVSTFDVSQTDGEPLPTVGVNELSGSVEGYATLLDAVKQTVPVPIGFEDIKSGAKGYYHLEENRIAIQEGMSEAQTLKTLIHEAAHQALHSREAMEHSGDKKTANQKETEAESIAYVVCQHYGIDTSDYSFAYVATWSADKEVPELKASLDTIRKTASDMIVKIDDKVSEITKSEFKDIEAFLAEHGDELPFGNPAASNCYIKIEPPVDFSEFKKDQEIMITAEKPKPEKPKKTSIKQKLKEGKEKSDATKSSKKTKQKDMQEAI